MRQVLAPLPPGCDDVLTYVHARQLFVNFADPEFIAYGSSADR